MSTFIGKHEAKADVKGRIFIPSAYRKLLPEGEKDQIVLSKDIKNDCFIIYPRSVWDKKVTKFVEKLSDWDSEDNFSVMQLVEDAEVLDIDSQGRILISKKNQQLIGVENSEVLFVGMIDRFAVWNKERFEAKKKSPDEFAAMVKERVARTVSS